MPKIEPFETYVVQYEEWFEKNRLAYESELEAVRWLTPKRGTGVEIGVGTGRFAAPLGIKVGIEPAKAMQEVAQKRGIDVIGGIAEAIPFEDGLFDFILMVTTICFVDDLDASFREAYRVIKPGGHLINGFVDRNSLVGKIYQQMKHKNRFYKSATFYSTDEVVSCMKRAGFSAFTFSQTIYHRLDEINEVEPVKEGYGEGSFLVVRGTTPGGKH